MSTNQNVKTRTESDLLGSVEVPCDVLYGVQTLRGLENFPISSFRLDQYPLFVNGLAIVKLGAAIANHELGLLTDEQYEAIAQACREIMEGKHHEFFPVDMIQGGAGTTTNMNANEVIANRALESWATSAANTSSARPTTMSTARSRPTTPIRRPSTWVSTPRTSSSRSTTRR